MPRQARVVAVGAPHHITQRGNDRQDVFFLDSDRAAYLALLAHYSGPRASSLSRQRSEGAA